MDDWNLPQTEFEAVTFLQDYGLIPLERECENGHKMNLCIGDRVFWREFYLFVGLWFIYSKIYIGYQKTSECYTKPCNNKRLSARKGTWFDGSKVSFLNALRFIYAWSHELTSIKWCDQHLQMCNQATMNWNASLREICYASLETREKRKIGGIGCSVEIEEAFFTKRKTNVAGRDSPPVWGFVGACRETGEYFLQTTAERSVPSVFAAISDNIQSGTTIYSGFFGFHPFFAENISLGNLDCFHGFQTAGELEASRYEQWKRDQGYNFVSPTLKKKKDLGGTLWGSANWRNKKQHLGSSYIFEFVWRKIIGKDAVFETILSCISLHGTPPSSS
jgi:hypothetical protein